MSRQQSIGKLSGRPVVDGVIVHIPVEGCELHERMNDIWWMSSEEQRVLKELRRKMK